ncbi:MAG: histidine--tRNA ligase [Acidobacteria bacterium]|nr:MAG: histidine--tRNA ligase [Acidobacteriota bacterium]
MKQQRSQFRAIRGVRDILPPQSALWNRVEQTAHDVFATYNFQEIRLPIFEQTELFARSVGADTDIVSKEMYTFEDYDTSELLEYRNAILTWQELPEVSGPAGPLGVGAVAMFQPFGELVYKFCLLGREAFDTGQIPRTPENDSLLKGLIGEREIFLVSIQSRTIEENRQMVGNLKDRVRQLRFGDSLSLRPEATASVVRAYIEHSMHTLPGDVKLYYMGPMFRRERPQKGRYRQFYQIGAEVLGQSDSPAIDAEVIEMLMAYLDRLGLKGATLYVNSIGCKECRAAYVAKLREELLKVKDQLGADSQRRIETNPLRVLDSKLEHEQAIIERLPRISDHLCAACREHFAELQAQLKLRSIEYKINWRLVRGLDYYTRTTFEITAPGLGAQNAICGGGRYDGLVELLGGPPTKGIGFAIGTDRLVLALQEAGKGEGASHIDVFVAWLGRAESPVYAAAVKLARQLREEGFVVELPPEEMKLKKSLGLADKLGARYALIIGDDEIASGSFVLKRLADSEQRKLSESELLNYLKSDENRKVAAAQRQS